MKVLRNTLCVSFFFARFVRSSALFSLQLPFETPVQLISSEVHARCAQKRVSFYLKSLLLLSDFNQNGNVSTNSGVTPCSDVTKTGGSFVVLCGLSGRHVVLEACFCNGSLRTR